MADAPSNSELAWRLDEIRQLLQGLVSRAEYSADLRAAEHRFTEIERDITTLQEQQAKREETRGSNVRQAVYAGLLPSIFLVLTLLVTILVSLRGK